MPRRRTGREAIAADLHDDRRLLAGRRAPPRCAPRGGRAAGARAGPRRCAGPSASAAAAALAGLTSSGASRASGRGQRTGAASSASRPGSSRLANAVVTAQILPGGAVGPRLDPWPSSTSGSSPSRTPRSTRSRPRVSRARSPCTSSAERSLRREQPPPARLAAARDLELDAVGRQRVDLRVAEGAPSPTMTVSSSASVGEARRGRRAASPRARPRRRAPRRRSRPRRRRRSARRGPRAPRARRRRCARARARARIAAAFSARRQPASSATAAARPACCERVGDDVRRPSRTARRRARRP